MTKTDVIIIGAGAAGLMCAIEAGKRGRQVIVLDHANKAGKKILMSGGGRCNFTNYDVSAENYISRNSHFCKSALSRFTQWDFIQLVQRYKIPYHERSHGQLFCDVSAKDILNMLLAECAKVDVEIQLKTSIDSIRQCDDDLFLLQTSSGKFVCESLVVATGGLSIPKMGATPFGYQIAEQFGLNRIPVSAGLVPFTLQPEDKTRFAELSGIAVDCLVSNERKSFHENLLFTHRGLSGPAILQISSYWQAGEVIHVNLLPDLDLFDVLHQAQKNHAQQQVKTFFAQYLPKRLVTTLLPNSLSEQKLQSLTQKQLELLCSLFQDWEIKPNGTEGYRTAEVTLGGVDVDEISSKTLEAKKVKGLYFVGEVLDVTGWLGGYNFQWAWSSGWCAGQYV